MMSLTERSTNGHGVVIGAGTMGGGIAAQLANAGWRVTLLDVTRKAARAGWERLQTRKPALLFLPEYAARITPGGLDEDAARLNDADWVVEAVAEDLAAKQSVLALVERHAPPECVVSSNTSGLSLSAMSANCSPAFQARFLGTHFLNPPRYLKLLEVVPLDVVPLAQRPPRPNSGEQRTTGQPLVASSPQTWGVGGATVVDGFIAFAEAVLGHRVVRARDTPGFISTRVGIRHLLDCIHLALEIGLTPEEADAVTGTFLGRPRTGTFRLADVVGLDIVAAIGQDMHARLPDDPQRARWLPPPLVTQLIEQGRVGDKSGAGFYAKREGQSLTLDFASGEYRPLARPVIAELDTLTNLPLTERLAALPSSAPDAGWKCYAVAVLDALASYVNAVGPEIANSAGDIDRVMCWGFGWELGPFALGAARQEAPPVPPVWGEDALHRGSVSPSLAGWGRSGAGSTGVPPPKLGGQGGPYVTLADVRDAGGLLQENDAHALYQMDGGALALELRGKLNVFHPQMTRAVDDARARAERDGAGLVIIGQGAHFSAGYNLRRFLPLIEAGDWAGIDAEMDDIQQVFLRLKYARVPVVAAARGFALGAGCECLLHCARVVAAPELKIGLPETAVGLAPTGGGAKELILRARPTPASDEEGFAATQAVWEVLMHARRSDNAHEARQWGLLRSTDTVIANSDRLLHDALAVARQLTASSYAPPEPPDALPRGSDWEARLLSLIEAQAATRGWTEFDRVIAAQCAHLVCGGDAGRAGAVTEQGLLDAERAAFLALTRRPETAARIEHTLATGKPLKN